MEEQKLQSIVSVDDFQIQPKPNFDGRYLRRKTVGSDKVTISTTSIQDGSVTTAKMADNAIKQAKLATEIVTLAFGSADTVKTAAVTTGSIILGVYSSTVTSTPAYGEIQLAISGTTLTGTRSASPGGTASITYVVILLKL